MTHPEAPSEHMVCKRCLVSLDWHSDLGWIHPLSQEVLVSGVAGHEPEPVLADSVLEHRYRCDFCFAVDPPWAYPCGSFLYPSHDGMPEAGSHEDWAVCDPCRDRIERNDRDGLVQRMMAQNPSFALVPRANRDEFERDIRTIVRSFFDARTGKAYRHLETNRGN